jgi:heat shock protein HtpX
VSPATRDRARRQRRAPENDGRARRAAEAQQAAYESSRVVLAAAARRRDAAWRHSARANRRRAAAALAAPIAVALVLVVLGIFSSAALIAGIVLACLVAVSAATLWARSAGVLARRLGGTVVTAERRPAALAAIEAARLVDVAEGLFAVFGLPSPEIRVLDDPAVNALSIGRSADRGVVLVTSGLVLLLDRIELEAVLAHELAHLKRGDTVSGAIAILGFDSLGRYVPMFARIADKVAGSDREPLADLAAVAVTRYPPGLISALEKISAAPSRKPSCLPRGLADLTSRLWLAPFEPTSDEPERQGMLNLTERIDVLREL